MTKAGDGTIDPRAWTGRLRAHLAAVAPYAAAGRTARRGLRLDANENALGPVVATDLELHRYPDPSGGELRTALANFVGVERQRLWLGSGADDAIDVLIRTVVDPGQRLVVTTPSYELYAQRGKAHGARVVEVPLDAGFDLDTEAVVRAAEGAPLVVLCSPNNPTGRSLTRQRVLDVLNRTEAVVAVDEAYVEFALYGESGSAAASRESFAGLAGSVEAERLVVIRTLSKAWGLAGLRTGYLVGAPPLVRWMDVVGLPYRLTAPAIVLGVRALEAAEEMRRRCRTVARERQRVCEALRRVGLRVLPSEANFLLFFVRRPEQVQEALAGEHGILVRRRDRLPGLDGALRVTIGSARENDAFLEALERTLGGPA